MHSVIFVHAWPGCDILAAIDPRLDIHHGQDGLRPAGESKTGAQGKNPKFAGKNILPHNRLMFHRSFLLLAIPENEVWQITYLLGVAITGVRYTLLIRKCDRKSVYSQWKGYTLKHYITYSLGCFLWPVLLGLRLLGLVSKLDFKPLAPVFAIIDILYLSTIEIFEP